MIYKNFELYHTILLKILDAQKKFSIKKIKTKKIKSLCFCLLNSKEEA